MTQTRIIACKTLRPEIEYLFKELGLSHEITWMEPSLHNRPEKLHLNLQDTLDSFSDCERVLMPFGSCGNATKELKTGNFEMIIPKVDDCLTLMLGSMEQRQKISAEAGTYFLTLGWIKQEENLFFEYDRTVNKFGEKMAKEINEMMYKHYSRVAMIDTGVGNADELLSYSKPVKELIGLDYYPVKGTLDYLRQLFIGPWDDKFFTIPPYSILKI